MLTILFDQHRRERIEELEAQALLRLGSPGELGVLGRGRRFPGCRQAAGVDVPDFGLRGQPIGYALVLAGSACGGSPRSAVHSRSGQVHPGGRAGWPIGMRHRRWPLIGLLLRAGYAAGMAKQAGLGQPTCGRGGFGRRGACSGWPAWPSATWWTTTPRSGVCRASTCTSSSRR